MAEFTHETLRRIEENGISTQVIEVLAWRYKLDVNQLDEIFERAGIEAPAALEKLKAGGFL